MFGSRELWMRWIQVGLVLAGAAVLARPTSSAVRRGWMSWRAEQMWADALRAPAAVVLAGEPAAWLEIPTANVDTLVVREGGDESLLEFPSVWTLPDPNPSNSGLFLIRAHRDIHFRGLQDVQVGDQLSLAWRQGLDTEYRVVETEVLDPQVALARVQEKIEEDWLVLMTCYPFSYIGPAPSRFLVWARPTSST